MYTSKLLTEKNFVAISSYEYRQIRVTDSIHVITKVEVMGLYNSNYVVIVCVKQNLDRMHYQWTGGKFQSDVKVLSQVVYNILYFFLEK